MATIIKRKKNYSVVYYYETESGEKKQKWELVGKNPFELSDALPKIKYKKRDIWDVETISKALDECRDGKLYIAMNLIY